MLIGGVVVTWPVAARAQQSAVPVIGFLHFGSPKPFAFQTVAFEQGLKDGGYVQGQSLLARAATRATVAAFRRARA